jgi:ribokinase
MRILNFGSLNYDKTYAVPHFVRPGETLSSQSLKISCGGKGLNQSVALAKAGAPVTHAGKVGRDGQKLIDCLKQFHVDTEWLQMDQETETGHAIIQVDATGQNSILLFAGANGEIRSEDIDQVLEHFEKGDCLLLQNEISCLSELIDKAYVKGLFIVLNPSPISESLKKCDFGKINLLILNEIEGAELSGRKEPDEILNQLLEKYPDMEIVLTLGEDGSCYADRNERFYQKAYPSGAVDTTAAGDTFTGYFLCCMLEGKTKKEALDIASRAASIAIGRNGASASIPFREEVDCFQ